MDAKFKPLLAHTVTDTSKIQYPVYVSPKLDGIRAIVGPDLVLSRKLIGIPNLFVQSMLLQPSYYGLDGELIVGPPHAKDVYKQSYSGVMTKEGEPAFTFYVFDTTVLPSSTPFFQRLAHFQSLDLPWVKVLPQWLVHSETELLTAEDKCLAEGYEGVMVRSLDGHYKFGRSTEKQGILGKVKRFIDDEFEIIGFEERMHNANEAVKDALGHTKRSTHAENKVGRGDLGAIVLKTKDGKTFCCGGGFDDATRRKVWDNQNEFLGSYAKVKYFAIGDYDVPRFPTFLGFRHPADM